MTDAISTHDAGPDDPAPGHPSRLKHHFDDLGQQREAVTLGMWVFLVTEVMFFGGLFAAYLVYRVWYPTVFGEASRELDLWLGATNTAVLILSSLTMALAVGASQAGKRMAVVGYLVVTMGLGATFLVIKGFEYHHKWVHHLVPGPTFTIAGLDPHHAQVFFSLYFALTGLHATHMVIGLGLLTVISIMAWRGRFSRDWNTPVEMSGLYWHFVDIIWIFLFPLLYLVDRHS